MIIGIPVYNDAEGLKYALNTLLHSTIVRCPIILLESESSDGSDKVCDYPLEESGKEIVGLFDRIS